MSTVGRYCKKWDQLNAFFELKEIHESKDAVRPRLCFSQQPALLLCTEFEVERFDIVKNEWRAVYDLDYSSSVFSSYYPAIVVQVNEHIYLFGEAYVPKVKLAAPFRAALFEYSIKMASFCSC